MKKRTIGSLLFICCSILISSCIAPRRDSDTSALYNNGQTKEAFEVTQLSKDTYLDIMYVDVGQADCEIIKLPNGENILIDAGSEGNANTIETYLKRMNITELDYVIATHPHEDHIGGMSEIIKSFKTDCIYMPDAKSNTNVFSKFLTTILEYDIPVVTAKAGTEIINADDIEVEVVAPKKDKYSNLNNYSIVIKLRYKDNVFLFMGDAEKQSEMDISADIHADVIKIGHHGSDTSTSSDFLQRVSPKLAVISVGKDNQYGFPDENVLNRLKNVRVLRTDINGSILLRSNGEKINIYTER